jgi:hypothetical protein
MRRLWVWNPFAGTFFMILVEIALGLLVLYLVLALCVKLTEKWKLVDVLRAWFDKKPQP